MDPCYITLLVFNCTPPSVVPWKRIRSSSTWPTANTNEGLTWTAGSFLRVHNEFKSYPRFTIWLKNSKTIFWYWNQDLKCNKNLNPRTDRKAVWALLRRNRIQLPSKSKQQSKDTESVLSIDAQISSRARLFLCWRGEGLWWLIFTRSCREAWRSLPKRNVMVERNFKKAEAGKALLERGL